MQPDLREIDRAMYDLVHDAGANDIARLLHKTPSTICHEVDANYEGAKFGLLDAVRAMVHRADFRLLFAMCKLCGFRVIPDPVAVEQKTAPELLLAFADLSKEVGEVFGSFNAAVSDGRMTMHEVATFERELFDVMRSGMSLAAQMRHQATIDAKRGGAQLAVAK